MQSSGTLGRTLLSKPGLKSRDYTELSSGTKMSGSTHRRATPKPPPSKGTLPNRRRVTAVDKGLAMRQNLEAAPIDSSTKSAGDNALPHRALTGQKIAKMVESYNPLSTRAISESKVVLFDISKSLLPSFAGHSRSRKPGTEADARSAPVKTIVV